MTAYEKNQILNKYIYNISIMILFINQENWQRFLFLQNKWDKNFN